MWIQLLVTFYISYKPHAYDKRDRNMLHNQCLNNHIQLTFNHDLKVCTINEYRFIILNFNEPVHFPYYYHDLAMRQIHAPQFLHEYNHINYTHFHCNPVLHLRFNKSARYININKL